MSVLNMTDLDLAGQRVLIREDFNVPVKDGLVTSAKRIKAHCPRFIWLLSGVQRSFCFPIVVGPLKAGTIRTSPCYRLLNILKAIATWLCGLKKNWLTESMSGQAKW